MPLFGTRRHRARDRVHVTGERQPRSGWARFYPRRDPDRVAGGYRTYSYAQLPLDRRQPCAHQKTKHTPAGAALANPNTTREGRRHAKWELRRMVRALFLHRNLIGSYDAALTSRAVGLMCRS